MKIEKFSKNKAVEREGGEGASRGAIIVGSEVRGYDSPKSIESESEVKSDPFLVL